MIGSSIFSLALIPSVLDENKPDAKTSFITATVLVSFCICYGTLGLWISFVATLICMLLWWVLFFQKIAQKTGVESSFILKE